MSTTFLINTDFMNILLVFTGSAIPSVASSVDTSSNNYLSASALLSAQSNSANVNTTGGGECKTVCNELVDVKDLHGIGLKYTILLTFSPRS